MKFKYKTLVFRLDTTYSSGVNPKLEEEMDSRMNCYGSQGYYVGDAYIEDNWLMIIMTRDEEPPPEACPKKSKVKKAKELETEELEPKTKEE